MQILIIILHATYSLGMNRKPDGIRQHTLVVHLNDREQKALEDHCRQYKIANRSRWVREQILLEVLRRAEQDSPMLFEEEEMR